MGKGKSLCEHLKKIREQIAEANGIDYAPRKCTFEGDCKGTCPVCERELGYLESQLTMKRNMGVPIKIIGLSVALASGAACTPNPPEICPSKEISPDSLDEVEACGSVEDDSFDTQSYFGDAIEGEIDFDPYDKAQFPGGPDSLKSFLQKNLHYPQEVQDEGIEGVVVVQFIVEKDGSISDAKAIRSVDSLLDTEVLRVVQSMPKWIPAEMDGKAVRSIFKLPVRFKLSNESEN